MHFNLAPIAWHFLKLKIFNRHLGDYSSRYGICTELSMGVSVDIRAGTVLAKLIYVPVPFHSSAKLNERSSFQARYLNKGSPPPDSDRRRAVTFDVPVSDFKNLKILLFFPALKYAAFSISHSTKT